MSEITLEQIEDVLWFTQMGARPMIGVVLVNTGFGYKAYIGTGDGSDEDFDKLQIATFGAKFHEGRLLWPDRQWWADFPETRPSSNDP
jgi:hypothetical protein